MLTGDRIIHRCDILFDCGHSFNPAVDMGQVLYPYHFPKGECTLQVAARVFNLGA